MPVLDLAESLALARKHGIALAPYALVKKEGELGKACRKVKYPVVLKLVSILKRAMPNTPPEDIFWGYHFVTGALMNTLARTGRLDRLSGGLCKSGDFNAVKQRMARFMAAGFLALSRER